MKPIPAPPADVPAYAHLDAGERAPSTLPTGIPWPQVEGAADPTPPDTERMPVDYWLE
jgi:hypothetical protein